jgi:GAF domain-containing protein
VAHHPQTPLSQSICHLVVATGAAVQIDDTAADERTRDHPARTVLDVASYLGVPLFDDDGNPLGTLCAIDRHPRAWSAADRDLLVELSAAARSEMRARIAISIAEQATRRVQALADASEVLSRTLDVDASLEAGLDLVTPSWASAAAIYLPESGNEAGRVLFRRAHHTAGNDPIDTPGHLNQILASEPVRSVLAGRSPHRRIATATLAGSGHDGDGQVLVVPLISRREMLGVLVVEPSDGLEPLRGHRCHPAR